MKQTYLSWACARICQHWQYSDEHIAHLLNLLARR